MKQKFIIIGIIVLMVVVGLSGCTETNDNEKQNNNTEKSKFIGTWTSPALIHNVTLIWTFYENNTFKIVYEEENGTNPKEITNETICGYWYSENGIICMADNLFYENDECYEYKFLDNNNKLTIKHDYITSVLTRNNQ